MIDFDEYDPKLTLDMHRRIRHHPAVVAHIRKVAEELASRAGHNFRVMMSTNESQLRPRAYVVPANEKGVHDELTKSKLLKAALSMHGR